MMTIGVRIAGVLLVATGLLAILMALFSSDNSLGVTLETGAVLLVGGVAAFGLSGVIIALENLRNFFAGEEQSITGLDEDNRIAAKPPIGGIGHPANSPKPAVPAQEQGQRYEPSISGNVVEIQKDPDDLIGAKENSKSAVDRVVEEVREFSAVSLGEQGLVSEEELYVVEERTIAGKPARILSDGTVEAETDDGWMRFENAEHLEEYMDAMRSQRG